MSERAVHLMISGKVQGVGYRAWLEDQALARGLAGWVRNRRDGSVEAVLSGNAAAVDAVVAAAAEGPRAAIVIDVAASPYEGPPLKRFSVLPTA